MTGKNGRQLVSLLVAMFASVLVYGQAVNILRDDFDGLVLDSGLWQVSGTGTGQFFVLNGSLFLEARDGGSRFLAPIKPTFSSPFTFSVFDGALTFIAKVTAPTLGSWGASANDRTNAIEFAMVPIDAFTTKLFARTVMNGVATETEIPVFGVAEPPPYWPPVFYSFVAESRRVRFYVNGEQVAVHRTDIPTMPLHVLIGVFSEVSGTRISSQTEVDSLSFERAPR